MIENPSFWNNMTEIHLFETIWPRIHLFETIWPRIHLFETIWPRIHLFETIWPRIHLFEILWPRIHLFETLWPRLHLFEMIWHHLICNKQQSANNRLMDWCHYNIFPTVKILITATFVGHHYDTKKWLIIRVNRSGQISAAVRHCRVKSMLQQMESSEVKSGIILRMMASDHSRLGQRRDI